MFQWRSGRAGLWMWLAFAGWLGQGSGAAQRTAPHRVATPPGTRFPDSSRAISAPVADALSGMAAQATVIFTGHVVAVRRADAAGYVDVEFGIDEAVAGCTASGTYVLREWAGLWLGQAPRYTVGERRLMLLHARGASGMSSPVGGSDGAIPLVAAGVQPVVDRAGLVAADDGTTASDAGVDLRWISARALRGVGAVSATARGALPAGSVARSVTAGVPEIPGPDDPEVATLWVGPIAPLSSVTHTDAAAVPASLGTVLALLRGAKGARAMRTSAGGLDARR